MGVTSDRKSDHVSLDHLSRLLVDVHMDSTKIMDDLLSQYQRRYKSLVWVYYLCVYRCISLSVDFVCCVLRRYDMSLLRSMIGIC